MIKNTLLELHYKACRVVFLFLLRLWNMKKRFFLVSFVTFSFTENRKNSSFRSEYINHCFLCETLKQKKAIEGIFAQDRIFFYTYYPTANQVDEAGSSQDPFIQAFSSVTACFIISSHNRC